MSIRTLPLPLLFASAFLLGSLATQPILAQDEASGKTSMRGHDEVPEDPLQVRPLLIGAKAPNATFQNSEGDALELKEMVAERGAVYFFFRGNW